VFLSDSTLYCDDRCSRSTTRRERLSVEPLKPSVVSTTAKIRAVQGRTSD